MAHYGNGRQPIDDIIDAGWGAAFCAGNVLKYLRRDKERESSLKKARWYWWKLDEVSMKENDAIVLEGLHALLTADEIKLMMEK